MDNNEEILKNVKEYCKGTFTGIIYSLVVEPIKIHSFIGNQVLLVTPTTQQKNVAQKEHLNALEEAFAYVTGRKCEVNIIEEKEVPEYDQLITVSTNTDLTSNVKNYNKTNLNSDYTFDKFVVGESNRIAFATAESVSKTLDNPLINPIFIYGDPGLGKTHLLHAIGNEALKNNPNLKIQYVTAERFLLDLVNAIKDGNNKTELFRQKYRSIDLFLMDDVQFLSGKSAAQDELNNTFNVLHDAKKQIVFAADKPPKEIPMIEERIQSRFNWGVIVDIGQPDYETRLAILKKKSEDKNVIIDEHILGLIAEKVDTNIRELEGVLNKVIITASLTKTPITIEIVERAINDMIISQKEAITPMYIIEVISKYFDVSIDNILSSKKASNIVYPRQLAMYFIRKELELPYQKISEIFRKKDHTTIMHAENKIEKEIENNKEKSQIVDSIKNIIHNKMS